MSTLRSLAASWLAAGQRGIVVEVTEARGSVPREAGARMLVSAATSAGTVGGGHLELQAIAAARDMLAAEGLAAKELAAGRFANEAAGAEAPVEEAPGAEVTGAGSLRHYALGPTLGQCCGGAVTLGFMPLDAAVLAGWPAAAPRFFLQLFGAGHVGRAIARALAPLDVQVDWIDEREAEFPSNFAAPGSAWPRHIRRVCVDAVEAEVDSAAPGAFYLVLTHRHDLDLRIGAAILRRGDFSFFGMIGSQTKRQRFIHRFEQLGLPATQIARMTCPIGLPGIDGKEPEVIAASVVAQLLMLPHGGPADDA